MVGCFCTRLAQEPMFLIFRSYISRGQVRACCTGHGRKLTRSQSHLSEDFRALRYPLALPFWVPLVFLAPVSVCPCQGPLVVVHSALEAGSQASLHLQASSQALEFISNM